MWGYICRYISMFETVAIRTYTAIHARTIALLVALKYKVNFIAAKSIGRCTVNSYTYVHTP